MVDFFHELFQCYVSLPACTQKNKTESVCSKGRVEVDLPPCSLYNCHLINFLLFHGWFLGSMLIFHGDMVHVKLPCMVLYTYIYHTNQPKIKVTIPYMDPMGRGFLSKLFDSTWNIWKAEAAEEENLVSTNTVSWLHLVCSFGPSIKKWEIHK